MREDMLCAGEEGKDSCSGKSLTVDFTWVAGDSIWKQKRLTHLNCWHYLGCRWQWWAACLSSGRGRGSTAGWGHFLGPGLWQVHAACANLPFQILTLTVQLLSTIYQVDSLPIANNCKRLVIIAPRLLITSDSNLDKPIIAWCSICSALQPLVLFFPLNKFSWILLQNRVGCIMNHNQ